MKKFIKISSVVIAVILTLLGTLATVSFVISLAKGISYTQYAIKGIVSLFLVLISGILMLIVKKDVNSTKFYVILGISAVIVILERAVFHGAMGFGSALFNLISQGLAGPIEKVLSVLLILVILYIFAIMFLSVMEKYTSKPTPKSKGKKR